MSLPKPYYQAGGITLYHGNSLELLPEMIGEVAVGHVITDPPYSDYTKNGARTHPNVGFDRANSIYIDFEISLDDLRSVLCNCALISSRWVIATLDWRHIAPLADTPPIGLKFIRFGVWIKPDGAPQFTGDRPAPGWEGVAIFHSAHHKMRWNAGGSRAVWTHSIVRASEIGHPTPKPIPLMLELITQFTDPGETILDPFAGSGTTLLAAKRLKRKAIGIELNEDYCRIAAERLDSTRADQRIGQGVLIPC